MEGFAARMRGISATVMVGAVVLRRHLRRRKAVTHPSEDAGRVDGRQSAEAALASIAGAVPGSVGFAAWHAETDRSLAINGRQPFPMASLVKLSLALHTFRQIDAGVAHLRDAVELTSRHWRPGSGLLAQYLTAKPIRVSVGTLVREMLQESDNSATDALLEWLGGPHAVREELGPLGLGVVAPTRSIDEALRDLYGMKPRNGAPGNSWWRDLAAVPTARREAAATRFFTDPRDAASAEDFVAFMKALWEGNVVSASSRRRLLGLMARARTGQPRILAGLPPGSWLAHKTGSFPDRYAADVGVARLPDGSHVILAAHVWSESPDRENENVIAGLTEVAVGFFAAPT